MFSGCEPVYLKHFDIYLLELLFLLVFIFLVIIFVIRKLFALICFLFLVLLFTHACSCMETIIIIRPFGVQLLIIIAELAETFCSVRVEFLFF